MSHLQTPIFRKKENWHIKKKKENLGKVYFLFLDLTSRNIVSKKYDVRFDDTTACQTSWQLKRPDEFVLYVHIAIGPAQDCIMCSVFYRVQYVWILGRQLLLKRVTVFMADGMGKPQSAQRVLQAWENVYAASYTSKCHKR